MPELPEVESIRCELSQTCSNQTIVNVKLHRAGLRFPFQENLAESLQGKTIARVNRRAKFIIFILSDGSMMISHLGMTGTWTWCSTNRSFETADRKKHDHVEIQLDDGKLIYNDPRRFGHLLHCKDFSQPHLPFDFKGLGVEPLSKEFTAATLTNLDIRNRTAPVKTVIMDQKVVVGVGNIYASEALFLAKVKPTRKFSSIKNTEAKQIVLAIQKVLKAGIKAGGTTLRDYRNLGEGKGSYQKRLKVYDRKGKPCVVCSLPVKAAQLAGRSTYWCSSCQK